MQNNMDNLQLAQQSWNLHWLKLKQERWLVEGCAVENQGTGEYIPTAFGQFLATSSRDETTSNIVPDHRLMRPTIPLIPTRDRRAEFTQFLQDEGFYNSETEEDDRDDEVMRKPPSFVVIDKLQHMPATPTISPFPLLNGSDGPIVFLDMPSRGQINTEAVANFLM
jgi:hypothetical protein